MTFVLVNSTVDFAQDSLLSNAILFRNRSDRAEINLLKIDCRKSSQTSEINNTLLSSTATSYHAIAVESLDCEYFPQCGGGGYPKLQSCQNSSLLRSLREGCEKTTIGTELQQAIRWPCFRLFCFSSFSHEPKFYCSPRSVGVWALINLQRGCKCSLVQSQFYSECLKGRKWCKFFWNLGPII